MNLRERRDSRGVVGHRGQSPESFTEHSFENAIADAVVRAIETGQNRIDKIEMESRLGNATLTSMRIEYNLYGKLRAVQARLRSALSRIIKREQTNTPRKPPLSGTEFTPQVALKSILKSSSTERSELLREFKLSLAEQKAGVARVMANLIEEVRKNPDSPLSLLYNSFIEGAEKYGINSEQKELALDILRLYKAKHDAVSDAREKYPTNPELYEALFGRLPKGKIEVLQGPITFYFKCYNPDDYTEIYYSSAAEDEYKSKEVAHMSAGVSVRKASLPGLDGAVIAENASMKMSQRESNEALRHEEEHAMQRLFGEKIRERDILARLNNANSVEEKKSAYINLLNYRREYIADTHGKAEALAYLKTNTKPRTIKRKLTKKGKDLGVYDFTYPINALYPRGDEDNDVTVRQGNNIIESWNPGLFESDKAKSRFINKYFKAKYKKTITDGIGSIKKLQRMGWDNDHIISLLLHEPLAKWPKLVKLLQTK